MTYPLAAKTVIGAHNVIKLLDYHPETHKHVRRDMNYAYIMASLFFPETHRAFLDGRHADKWKDSMLFKQKERGESIPDRRGYRSGRHREPDFFKDLEDIRKRCVVENKYLADLFPLEWDVVTRPKIARCKLSLAVCSGVITDILCSVQRRSHRYLLF